MNGRIKSFFRGKGRKGGKCRTVLLFTLLLAAAAASAQDADRRPPEGVAILARGSYSRRGLSFISTNVIPYRAGEYRFDRGDVTVFFPEQEVLLSELWSTGSCGGRSLMSRDVDGGRVYLVSDGGRQIFFRFRGTDAEIECPFITMFLNRFAYFSGVSDDPDRLSLPAVVEFGG
jgi:hypothetical protein